MIIKITKRRRNILNSISEYITANGYAPTIREISKLTGIKSTGVIKFNLDRLIEGGLLKRHSNQIRGLEIVHIPNTDYVVSKFPQINKSNIKRKGRKEKTLYKFTAMEYFNGCAYCGINDNVLEVDHFLPFVLGGSDKPSNLIPACIKCNRTKSDKEPVKWVVDNYGQKRLEYIIKYICTV
jgi:hypothetical protein